MGERTLNNFLPTLSIVFNCPQHFKSFLKGNFRDFSTINIANGSTTITIPIDVFSFPIALRWEVFFFLFTLIVALESMVILFSYRNSISHPKKLYYISIVLVTNIITSCLMIPALLLQAVWEWDDFPLMFAASNIRSALRDASGNVLTIWVIMALIFSFLLLFAFFGVPSLLIEGAIFRFLTYKNPRKMWFTVGTANIISHLFLTFWSTMIGFGIQDMSWQESSDYIFRKYLTRPSDGEFSDLSWLGWIIFTVVIFSCFCIMLLGNISHRDSSEISLFSKSLTKENSALYLGFGYSSVLNFLTYIGQVKHLLSFLFGPLLILWLIIFVAFVVYSSIAIENKVLVKINRAFPSEVEEKVS